MKKLLFFSFSLFIYICAFSQKRDTIEIRPVDLNLKALQLGTYSYIVFNKATKESPAQRLTLVKMDVSKISSANKLQYQIKQKWETDTVVHLATTALDGKTFATIKHVTWWKRLGYTMNFDFENRTVSFDGIISDSAKNAVQKEFNESFDAYNLNWHSDLVVFSVLPYADNRSFIINYFDPGFGAAEKVIYSVTGSDTLYDHSGKPVLCWILKYDFTQNPGYQKFWVSKQTREILKEEDFFRGGYRYKIKLETPADF